MNKEESNIIKGVAILMMLFLHLFCLGKRCDYFIYIGDTPLLTLLTKASNPVPFFLLISGYGQYAAFLKGDKNKYYRILRLYIHYCLIFLIFFTIMCCVRGVPEITTRNMLSNLIGYDTNIAPICWFVFPFILMSLVSHFVFRLLEREKSKNLILSSFCIYLIASYLLSRYSSVLQTDQCLLRQLVTLFNIQFPFILGAFVYKYKLYEIIRSKLPNKYIILILIFLIVSIKTIIGVDPLNPFYTFLMIPLLLNIMNNKIMNNTLSLLGRHSMNIWMIHGWYCYYIFGNELYSLKYPLLIFSSCLLVSLLSSYIINILLLPIENKLR